MRNNVYLYWKNLNLIIRRSIAYLIDTQGVSSSMVRACTIFFPSKSLMFPPMSWHCPVLAGRPNWDGAFHWQRRLADQQLQRDSIFEVTHSPWIGSALFIWFWTEYGGFEGNTRGGSRIASNCLVQLA